MKAGLHFRRRACAYSSAAFAFSLISIFLVVPAFAARLGGAYYVDDAEIGKPGSCEIESWSSFAANGDRIAVFSPACVVNPGRPVELGTNLVDLRSEGQEDVLATLTAKTVPIPIGRTGFGLAIAGAIVYDPLNQTGSGLIVNIPVSFEFSKALRVNVNFGAQYYSGGERPTRIVRHRRRGRVLEFRAALERHLGGVRVDGPRPNQPALSKRIALQPHKGHRLRSDLRPQSDGRSCQLDHRGADRADRRRLIMVSRSCGRPDPVGSHLDLPLGTRSP